MQALMHINAYPGAELEEFAMKLQEHFKGRIVVKNIDDFLRPNSKNPKDHMERQIESFLKQHTLPVVLFGTAVNSPHMNQYPKIDCKYPVFLDVTLKAASKHWLKCQLEEMCKHIPHFIHMSEHTSREKLEHSLNHNFNLHNIMDRWRNLHHICVKHKYETLNRSEIVKLIQGSLRLH